MAATDNGDEHIDEITRIDSVNGKVKLGKLFATTSFNHTLTHTDLAACKAQLRHTLASAMLPCRKAIEIFR